MSMLPEFKESNYGKLFVKYFGYECEGAFNEDYDDRDDDGDRINSYFRHDGSVECAHEADEDYLIDGEIASPKFRIDRRLQFRQFVRLNEPTFTNNTAGIHVHVSFNNALAYQKCCDVDFYKLFRKEVWRFMHNGLFSEKTVKAFEARFNGSCSTYCRDGFNPDYSINGAMRKLNGEYFSTEVSNATSGRYNCINFEAFRKYGTIECRMFPSSSNSDEIIAMVEFWIEFVQNYLNTVTPYERGNFEKCSIDDEDVIQEEEVTISCV